MKIETATLIGPALDWAVAHAEGAANMHFMTQWEQGHRCYSTDWAQGGPIIDRMHISTLWLYPEWVACPRSELVEYFRDADGCSQRAMLAQDDIYSTGPTALVAAMRCHVAGVLGELVDIPDALVGA